MREPIAGPNFRPFALALALAILFKVAVVYVPKLWAEDPSAVIDRLEHTYGVTLERQSSN